MAYVFDITVDASLEDSDLISRILDFKEDLHRECFRSDYLTVSSDVAVDRALESVSFTVSSKGGLSKSTKLMKKSMTRHGVEDAIVVRRR